MAEGEFTDEIVDLRGEDARLHEIGEFVETARRQGSGLAHSSETARTVQFDLSGLSQGGFGGFDVTHQLV
ncbi:hypothetical protein NWI01_08770 [Nitrobacter winogradskyi]|uniref:Uncharacterized protein n=1 Tax=Nitrobacter winogradskyi TaxID=913 RepID=A0A4Y3W8T0_NITWI|nr:hypothetical protein NWI01_08770 [Nitrobacter winogradskyi]